MSGFRFAITDAAIEEQAENLKQAYLVGVDRMPWRSNVEIGDGLVSVFRDIDESGCLHLPWRVNGFGNVFVQTASLRACPEPYRLSVELARGLVNLVRGELAAWAARGLVIPDRFQRALRTGSTELLAAIRSRSLDESEERAGRSLFASLWLSEALVEEESRRSLQQRSRSAGSALATLGCAVDDGMLAMQGSERIKKLFQHVSVPLNWDRLEPQQGNCQWELLDRRIDWCLERGIPFSVGPILDLRPGKLPAWLGNWQSDPRTAATFMVDLVESCVARYRDKVDVWETTAGANSSTVLSFSDEQMLWIAVRMIEIGRNIDQSARFVLTIDEPWGEYLARSDRSYSAFSFVDTLTRMSMPIDAVNLEIVMGNGCDGAHCRSLLDFSRLLDHYHELELPLRVRLSFPSELTEAHPAPVAPRGLAETTWRLLPGLERQAEWADRFCGVALSKSFVETVTWGRFRDDPADPNPFGGLVDADGGAKPALARMCALRERVDAWSEETPT